MSHSHQESSGFTTVELLVAIFIAAAFITTGYQLFSAVMKDGNDARLRSRASSVAYENIRKHSHLVNIPCSPTPSNKTPTAPSDLPGGKITISYSCPYGNTSSVTRVKAVVQYGSGKSVEEAIDVSK